MFADFFTESYIFRIKLITTMTILIHSDKAEEIDSKIIRLMAIIYANLLCDVQQLVYFLTGFAIIRIHLEKTLVRILKFIVILA